MFFESRSQPKKMTTLKVHFPSPYEDGMDIKQFFALMRVALKSAEKTYDEVVKGLTEEEKSNFYLRFNSKFNEEEKVKKLEEEIDPNYSKTQEVWLEILSV